MRGCPLKISTPIVSYRESVSAPSSLIAVGKSPNKHNRISMSCEPAGEEFVQALEEDPDLADSWKAKAHSKLAPGTAGDVKQTKAKGSSFLVDELGWNREDSRRVWSFGLPPDALGNVLVDQTKGAQHLQEAREGVAGAFQECTLGGVFCGEPLRGVRFNFVDVKLHGDSAHRGANQVTPATRSAVYAAQISAKPILLEPVFRCDISVPRSAIAGVYATLRARRAVVVGTMEPKSNASSSNAIVEVLAHLPVAESFGFTELLRRNTSGQAFPQTIFSHWQPVKGDIMEEGSPAHTLCMAIRARKGMKLELPKLNDYHSADVAGK